MCVPDRCTLSLVSRYPYCQVELLGILLKVHQIITYVLKFLPDETFVDWRFSQILFLYLFLRISL